MTRAFAPPGPAPLVRRAAAPRRARSLQSFARAATGLACGALADVGEMLVVSLLTAGAAAAAACALASLVLWIGKALAAVVLRGPAQALARRMPIDHATSIAGEPTADSISGTRTAMPSEASARPARTRRALKTGLRRA